MTLYSKAVFYENDIFGRASFDGINLLGSSAYHENPLGTYFPGNLKLFRPLPAWGGGRKHCVDHTRTDDSFPLPASHATHSTDAYKVRSRALPHRRAAPYLPPQRGDVLRQRRYSEEALGLQTVAGGLDGVDQRLDEAWYRLTGVGLLLLREYEHMKRVRIQRSPSFWHRLVGGD